MAVVGVTEAEGESVVVLGSGAGGDGSGGALSDKDGSGGARDGVIGLGDVDGGPDDVELCVGDGGTLQQGRGHGGRGKGRGDEVGREAHLDLFRV